MAAVVRLSDHGVTFATYQRAAALAADMPDEPFTLDFTGVKAATPSFLNGLFGALSERGATVTLTGLMPQLDDLAVRIIERRGEGDRFTVLATA